MPRDIIEKLALLMIIAVGFILGLMASGHWWWFW